MTEQQIEQDAREYALQKGSSTSEHERVVGFAIQQVNAALEEAAQRVAKNCLDVAPRKPCVFCRQQADDIRALKVKP